MDEKQRQYRGLRFSLRSLLLLVTAFSVWLGVEVDRAHRQATAVKVVRSLGGQTYCDFQFSGTNTFFVEGEQVKLPRFNLEAQPTSWTLARRYLGDSLFDRVTHLYVGVPNADDRMMASVSDLRYLRDLSLSGQITDENFRAIGRLAGLKALRLRGTRISGAAGARIARLPRLSLLDMRDAYLNNDGWRELSRATRLEWLDLGGTQISDAGAPCLLRLPGLEYLNLSDTAVSDATLEHVGTLVHLKRLCLNGTCITDLGLRHLDRLAELEMLALNVTHVTDSGLQYLRHLTTLNLLW